MSSPGGGTSVSAIPVNASSTRGIGGGGAGGGGGPRGWSRIERPSELAPTCATTWGRNGSAVVSLVGSAWSSEGLASFPPKGSAALPLAS